MMKLQPELRFKEFSGDWEEKKIGDYLVESRIKGDTGDKAHKLTVKLWKKGVFAKNEVTKGSENTQYFIRKTGQLIYSKLDFLNCAFAIIPEELDGYQSTIDLPCFDFKKEINKYFFLERITQLNFYKQYGDQANGSRKAKRINPNVFFEMPFLAPCLEEQEKIASFLSSVDEKIQKLEGKKEKLEEYKKGIMQKIFSQEIRFKNKDGQSFPDWEEKRLGEIFKIGSGKDYKHLNKGNIPVYGTGGYMTSVDQYLYNGESVCIGRKGTIDKPRLIDGKFWTVDTLFYTHSFKGVKPKFVYLIFQTINWKYYNEASGVPSLSKTTIEKINTSIPCFEEQEKIADFLSTIDKKIEVVNTKIDETKEFKKGLLQGMFV